MKEQYINKTGFEIGDVVERTNTFLGYNNMKIGDIDKIIGIRASGLVLKRFKDGHSSENFKLINRNNNNNYPIF